MKKTNAARILDGLHIDYELKTYPTTNDYSVEYVALVGRIDINIIFKTLAVRGDRTGVMLAVIGAKDTLDLKALAKVTGNKSVEMLPLIELLPTTGYQRGGCSPLGAKKNFPVYLDQRALTLKKISVSAGRRGEQIILSPLDLLKAADCAIANIVAH